MWVAGVMVTTSDQPSKGHRFYATTIGE